MDNIARGGGGSGGIGGDGAFERFLTAAIATIITIMFSWRLLEEGNEAEGDQPMSVPPQQGHRKHKSNSDQGGSVLGNHETLRGDETPSNINSEVNDSNRTFDNFENAFVPCSQAISLSSSHSDLDCFDQQADNTVFPTWDEYRWEDDIDDEGVHTRRTVTDFVTCSGKEKLEIPNAEDVESEHVKLLSISERGVENVDMKDNVEDSGCVDLYPDESDDSDDSSSEDEHIYELQVSDSDSDSDYDDAGFFGGSVLEPIIEEDSDDFEYDIDSDGDNNNKMDDYLVESGNEGNQPVFDVCHSTDEKTSHALHVREPEQICENDSSGKGPDVYSKVDDTSDSLDNLTLVSNFNQFCEEKDKELKSQQEGGAFCDTRLNENVENIKDNITSVYNITPIPATLLHSEGCLPPSPIRTCALDNFDDIYSDSESCSSESVLTVISVRSCDSDTRVHDFDEEEDDSLLETPMIDRVLVQASESEDNTSLLNLQRPENFQDKNNTLMTDVSLDSYTSSRQCSIDSETKQLKEREDSPDGEMERSFLNYKTSADEWDNDFFKKEGTKIFMRNSSPHFNDSSSDSSDVQPREYDPDEDDFASFQHSDSDDDSFYLFVGNEGNLRKLDTIANLKYIGRSPGYGDAWTSSTIEETARGFSFSQMEDISTNTRFRSYVVDRDSSREGSESSHRSDDEYEIQCEKVLDDPVEYGDVQVQAHNMRNSQKTTTTNYEDAAASGSSCYSVTQVDGNIDFDRYIIKPACSEDKSQLEPDEQNLQNELETNADIIIDGDDSLSNEKEWNSNFRDINGMSCSFDDSTDQAFLKYMEQSPKFRHEGADTRYLENSYNYQAVEIKDKPDDENSLHHNGINENTVPHKENCVHTAPISKPYPNDESYIYEPNDIEIGIQDGHNNEVELAFNELCADDLYNAAYSDKEVEDDHSLTESVSDNMESGHINISDGEKAPADTLTLDKSSLSKQLEPACIQCSELVNQDTHELNEFGQELCIADNREPCHAPYSLQAVQSVTEKKINGLYTSNKTATTDTIKSSFIDENNYKSPPVGHKVADELNRQSCDKIHLNNREQNNLLPNEGVDNNMDVGLEPNSVKKPVDSSIIAPYSERQQLERLDNSLGEFKGVEGDCRNLVHSSNRKEQNEKNCELENIEQSIRSVQLSFDINKGTVPTYFTPSGGKVIRTSSKRPSELRGVQRRIQRYHRPKEYTSVLLQPVTPEKSHCTFVSAEIVTPPSRLRIIDQRNKFLSAEDLSFNQSFDDLFNFHKTSLLETPSSRRYLKKHERDRVSTESLPTDISSVAQNLGTMEIARGERYNTIDISRLSRQSPRQHDHSLVKPEIHSIHADCIFSPRKKEEIQHTTKSLEDMFEELLRYDSVSSLATSGLKSNSFVSHEQFFDDTDINFLSFQYPLQRAASMSELGSKQRFFRRKRFVDKNVTKSKSLQTLETNLDDVFAKEDEIQGELKKAPSEHELRISKSLQKLHVPDWYKKSSFSRSGSTQSLFTYAGRGSNSTLNSLSNTPSVTPSPCPTPGSNTVIIKTRVIPSTSTKLIRAPMLPTTPEKSPISPVSPIAHLPSDRFRQKEKSKELKPIAIVPFAKIREMFELKSRSEPKHAEPVQSLSPTEKTPHKILEWSRPVVHTHFKSNEEGATTPTSHEVSDVLATHITVSTLNSAPNVVEKKDNSCYNVARKDETFPGLDDTDIGKVSPSLPSKSVGLAKQQRVHFSDEKPPVSNSQEQNSTTARYSSATSNKPQSQKTSLRFPFKFPASRLTSASQSKKGKVNATSISSGFNGMHALDCNNKTDAELMFEFLQKRRYSRILTNGFAEQLDDLHVSTSDPVLSFGKHSMACSYANELDGIYGDDLYGIYGSQLDCSEDMKVMLSSFRNNLTNGVYQSRNLEITSSDGVLDRLLSFKEQRAALKRMQKHISEDTPSSPGSPAFQYYQSPDSDSNDNVFMDSNENVDFYNSAECDYVLVKCENPNCNEETNLKEAKHFYKTCHSCFTYYCSRNCRKEHWSDHKEICIYSRINSRCKHVIRFINRNPDLQYHCSKLARRCYLSQGRGCIVFAFPDVEVAENFIIYGLKGLQVSPVFVSLKKIQEAVIFGDHTSSLLKTCQQYNPDLKYAVHVAIVVPPDVPPVPVTRRKDTIIQKSAKLKLSPAHLHQRSEEETDEPSTLILTAVPGNKGIANHDRKARELCFINIQRKLRQRGVSLRHQFPHVYNKFIDFVSEAKHFSPMIIYPTDTLTQKTFMCVIMPESEPEIEWITPPSPFNELAEREQ